MQNSFKLGFLGRFVVIYFAVVVMLSALSPLYQIDKAGAASAFPKSTTVYINDDNYADFNKTGVSIVAQLYSSGSYLGDATLKSASSQNYSHTVQTSTTSTTSEIRLVRKDTSVPAVTDAIESGKQRLFFSNTAGWSSVKAYSWYMNGSSSVKELGEWPGSSMTRVGSTSYYYIDVPNTSKYVIFNDGADSQTDNLSIDVENSGNLYTFSSNMWTEYGVLSTISIDVTNRPSDSANTVYITGENSYKWSKYALPLNQAMTTVYVKAPSWSNAYVAYDPTDPLSIVTQGSVVDTNGNSASSTGFFKFSVPVGSTFFFKPNSGTNNAGSTDNIAQSSVPTTLSKPCYDISSKRWIELSQAGTDPSNYSVPNTFSGGIVGVKATYYDYLSDNEMSSGWRNAIQAGTGFNGAEDDWFPFDKFNDKIKGVADSNSAWKTPLYFGNFVNTNDGPYNTSAHGARNGNYYGEISYLTRFNYGANNSNGLTNANYSIRGLVGKTLKNGNITSVDGTVLPYFDSDELTSSSRARVIDSYFPFATEDKGDGVVEYSFDSNGAKDNVYFTWENDEPTAVNYGSGTGYGVKDGISKFMNPDQGYSSGYGFFPFNTTADNSYGASSGSSSGANVFYYDVPAKYDRVIFRNKDNHSEQYPQSGGLEIKDNYCYDVDSGTWGNYTGSVRPSASVMSGYKRIFVTTTQWLSNTPDLYLYNSSTNENTDWNKQVLMTKTTETSSSSSSGAKALNYGFGVKLDIDFRVPENGIFKNGEAVQFEFTGDDDLWVYITDSKGNSQLVLDMGGAHKRAHGEINFNTMQSKVYSSAEANTSGNIENNWGINDQSEYVTDIGFVANNGSTQSKSTYNCLDPDETYHMTVFYMERGLIESNMSISFTLTPLDNDLTVTKNVDTSDVNAGLKDEVLANEEFTYTIYDDNALATDRYYSKTERAAGNTSSNGQFTLGNMERVRFDTQFDVYSALKVVENQKSIAGLSYSTSWTVSDNNTGGEISTGDSTTSQFDFINSQNNENVKTSLYLEYTNKSKVAPIKVTKEVIDENLANISAKSNAVFDYTIAFDLYEGDTFNTTLDPVYSLYNSSKTKVGTYTAVDGAFSIKAGQYVVFEGIPQGAKYKITEAVKDGYSLNKATVNNSASTVSNNSFTATVGDDNDVVVTNMYQPVGAKLTAYKKLDGKLYNGNEFKFQVTGLDSAIVGGVKTKDTTSVSVVSKTATNGLVTFENTSYSSPFIYSEVGTYCYKIEEVAEESTDYLYDDTVYYAKVVVTSSSGKLVVSSPTYYTDSAFENQIIEQNVMFINEYADCEVRILKKNFNGTLTLSGGEFKLVSAKQNDNGDWVENTASNFTAVIKAVENHDGSYYAKFEDVPQGDYLVIETKAPKGYEISANPMHIEVVRNDENEGILEIPFKDIEASLLPNAGGNGFAIYVYVAVVLLSLSAVLFLKRNSKEKKAYASRYHR